MQIQCPAYTPPAHSEVLAPSLPSSALNHSQTLHLQCLAGYAVAGAGCERAFNVTCSDAVLFSHPAGATCVPTQCGCGLSSCPLWRPVNSASVRYVTNNNSWGTGSIAHGTKVKVTCNSGFRAVHGSELAFLSDPVEVESECQSCVMSPDIQCLPISCKDLQINTSHTEASHVVEPLSAKGANVSVRIERGATVKVSCPDGYRLGSRAADGLQHMESVCQSDGSFSNPAIPACLRIACTNTFSVGSFALGFVLFSYLCSVRIATLPCLTSS